MSAELLRLKLTVINNECPLDYPPRQLYPQSQIAAHKRYPGPAGMPVTTTTNILQVISLLILKEMWGAFNLLPLLESPTLDLWYLSGVSTAIFLLCCTICSSSFSSKYVCIFFLVLSLISHSRGSLNARWRYTIKCFAMLTSSLVLFSVFFQPDGLWYDESQFSIILYNATNR